MLNIFTAKSKTESSELKVKREKKNGHDFMLEFIVYCSFCII